MQLPTVRIKVKPCAGNPDGIVVMNEADYLASKENYELHDPAKESAQAAMTKELEEKAAKEKAEAERLEKERLEKEKAEQEQQAQEESPRKGKR